MICAECGDKKIKCDHCMLAEAQSQLKAADELAKAYKLARHDELNQCSPSCELKLDAVDEALAAYDKARGGK